jgi:alpha-ketoglutarate-dependent taurine dioxygenase
MATHASARGGVKVKDMRVEAISGACGAVVHGSPGESVLDLDPKRLVELFTSAGALLLRGFTVELDAFNKFSATFGAEFMTYKGGSYVRRTVNDGKDATLLSTSHEFGRETQDMFGLPLHGEMYYLDNRPIVLWFYCVIPPASGGETTICDGSRIYEGLRPSTKELFAAKRLKYVRTYRDGEWQKIYGTDDVAEVERFCHENGLKVEADPATRGIRTEYVHPAVITSRWGQHSVYINNMLPVLWQESLGRGSSIVRFEDDSTVPADVVDELVRIQERLIIPVAWRTHDVLMLDNTRFMHGRRAFEDPRREICLRMSRALNF